MVLESTRAMSILHNDSIWQQNIDQLVADHQSGSTVHLQTDITKHHWVPSWKQPNCQGCDIVFSLIERHHHCRSCGGVFCHVCSSYKRRLSYLAKPDPNGRLFKVCRNCFEEGPQTIGFSKNWKNVFLYFRNKSGEFTDSVDAFSGNGHSGDIELSRNIRKECLRLKKGFYESIGSAGSIRQAFSEMKNAVTIPDWQKAQLQPLYALRTKCSICKSEFGMRLTKLHCTVCGITICSKCSTKDLIVYIKDKSTLESDVHLAIIKIIGCPSEEPSKCVYLRVCNGCKDLLEQRQIEEYRQQLESERAEQLDSEEKEESIESVNAKLRNIQSKIDSKLPRYHDIVEELDIATRSNEKKENKSTSNIQILAKCHGDLDDSFSNLVMMIGNMKKLEPSSRTQMILLKNVLKANSLYYQENMYQYRELKRRLQEFTPTEVLVSIQDIVDRNAINGCFLSIKQLMFEVLHLCTTYKLPDFIVRALMPVEQVVEKDLKRSIQKANEDWDQHESCCNELLKVQLKKHRLIRPSRRLMKEFGKKHVYNVLKERSLSVVEQVLFHLCAKSADSSFASSKDMLNNVKDKLEYLNSEVETDDWVIT